MAVTLPRLPTADIWRGRRVLVTGHTGFKGAWLTAWLTSLGADVMGISLPEPVSEPDLWSELALPVTTLSADISQPDAWSAAVRDFAPSVVIHLAAQSLVSVGFQDPAGTMQTNVVGTLRVLEVLDVLPSLDVALIVTTDKVYAPGAAQPHTESSPIGGTDPYSASKAAVEMLVPGWQDLRSRLATVRAGNVIGGGDWAQDRLIPDAMRAWSAGRDLLVRRPEAVRPWQHVLEPLRGYLLLAERGLLGETLPPAVNFGPARRDLVTVGQLVGHASTVAAAGHLGRTGWSVAPVRPMAEVQTLAIDSTLAGSALRWRGVLSWAEAIDWTIRWYVEHAQGVPAAELVGRDIEEYSATVTAAGDE